MSRNSVFNGIGTFKNDDVPFSSYYTYNTLSLLFQLYQTLNGIGIFKNDDVWFPTYYIASVVSVVSDIKWDWYLQE